MGVRVLLLYVVVLIALLAVVTCKKSPRTPCPSLPCNKCQCKKMQECGRNLRNEKGLVQLPLTGPNSCVRCEWTLTVKPKQKVLLKFSQFYLRAGDWIKIFDGPTITPNALIVKYDGDSVPTDLISSGNKMVVLFLSDKCGDASRVTASFQAADCGGLIRLDPTSPRKRKTMITSPKFPRLYPSNANCLWTVISTDPIMSVRVTVNTVHTENGKDFVKVFESLRGPSAVRSYTGLLEESKRFKVTNEPGVAVQFLSDKNIAERGFKITIEALRGVFSCPNPRKLKHGRFAIVDHKRTAYYYCCEGYSMVGSPRMTCENGEWISTPPPKCTRLRSCPVLDAPDNSHIVDNLKSTKFGSVVKFRCNEGFEYAGTSEDVVTATCHCNGKWSYIPTVPRCDAKTCGSPPPAPQPEGEVLTNSFPPYGPGTVVNYTCPDGHGLDGIPYRTCNRLGKWVPETRHHSCRLNMNVCPDPGTPGNGTRIVVSFGDGHLASFGCLDGYRAEGSNLRTCHASDPNNTYWSGTPIICIDLFEDPFRLAADLRVNFVDRNVVCLDEDDGDRPPANQSLREDSISQPSGKPGSALPTAPSSTSATVTTTPIPTVAIDRNSTDNSSDNQSARRQGGFCRGRSVAVGDGCLDLIYAVDCSKSINETSFNQSLDFVGSSVSLFDIDAGQANVALFTYDDKVHVQFKLGQLKTTAETVQAINSAYYCQGSTATRPVLLRIEKEIIERSNDSCKKAIFILTDGNNNWGGDPLDIATRLKNMPKVEIYTVAFGTNSLNWEVLRSLASKRDYFIPVRHPGDILKAIQDAHDIKIDYSSQCGTTNSPDCRARVVGGCDSSAGAWPWMVAIYDNLKLGYNFRCGGTLIGDCWVLTAAHCFPRADNIRPENLLAVLGDTERFVKQFTESSHDVETIFVHNDYDPVTYDNDIALLQLKCSVQYKSQIRKGCLPRSGDERYYNQGTNCIVAGWGHTTAARPDAIDFKMSTVLRHVELPVEDLDECRRTSRYPVTEHMVCAGTGNTDGVLRDACRGDSGGPLFCKRTDNGAASYVVIGVVSWGAGCAQENKYGYYTDVKQKTDWIDDIMSQNPCLFSHQDCPPPRKTMF